MSALVGIKIGILAADLGGSDGSDNNPWRHK